MARIALDRANAILLPYKPPNKLLLPHLEHFVIVMTKKQTNSDSLEFGSMDNWGEEWDKLIKEVG